MTQMFLFTDDASITQEKLNSVTKNVILVDTTVNPQGYFTGHD